MKHEMVLALDVDSVDKAKNFVNLFAGKIKVFKVGLQLFTLAGPGIVDYIRKKKADVFLDLKLHDIPNTVAHAVRQAARLKVKMLTLHIQGGEEMLRAAVLARDQESRKLRIKKPLLIGVTVLTSQPASQGQVLLRAKQGLSCGLDGVVCSAREAAFLRQNINQEFFIVTPGIRSLSLETQDQKRVTTVRQAVLAGSNFLVVGRPILEAGNPLQALKELKSMASEVEPSK
ncbi:MAG: orotidine-5'-phosphate decarboxylase [Candidatus Omnitrophica bacterium]|jgi:orotidine-5'-phosphate decarboxylase|nr:orotidine-5'-phosphate decarboxylase [Candidatus Omnitrophota bacterium]